MNVAKLIEELSKIENKEQLVYVYTDGGYWTIENIEKVEGSLNEEPFIYFQLE